MPRYIDADKAKTFFEEIDAGSRAPSTLLTPYEFAEYLDEILTADVQEVRHGRWIYCGKSSGRDHMWQCSECLRTESTKHKSDIKYYPYCHCGAKMDGSVDDKIEYWHNHETGNSLIEFLGMTEQEYFDFCMPKQAIKDGENYLIEKGGEE